MSSKNRAIISIIMLIIFITGAYVFYSYLENGRTSLSPAVGQGETLAPDFMVQDSNGNTVRLSDFYGKPIVLNFWASWCPPCKSEMPDFNQVYNQLDDQVVFLMVNETDGNRETIENGKSYIEDQGFTFPVYYDIGLEAGYLYNVTAIPTTYFIDKNGNIYNYVKGTVSKDVLMKNIDKIR